MAKKAKLIAEKRHIGCLAVPDDNSYCIDVQTGEDCYVAGIPLTIISQPIVVLHKPNKPRAKPRLDEFVLCRLGKKYVRVINRFRAIKE